MCAAVVSSPSAPSAEDPNAPAEVLTEFEPPQLGKAVRIIVRGQPIAVFNVRGKLYALDAECGHHRSGRIENGEVRDGVVICPKHHVQFRLDTGEVAGGSSFIRRGIRAIHTYRVRSVEGRLAVVLAITGTAASAESDQSRSLGQDQSWDEARS